MSKNEALPVQLTEDDRGVLMLRDSYFVLREWEGSIVAGNLNENQAQNISRIPFPEHGIEGYYGYRDTAKSLSVLFNDNVKITLHSDGHVYVMDGQGLVANIFYIPTWLSKFW